MFTVALENDKIAYRTVFTTNLKRCKQLLILLLFWCSSNGKNKKGTKATNKKTHSEVLQFIFLSWRPLLWKRIYPMNSGCRAVN